MVDENKALDFGILLGLAYQTFTDRLREALARDGFDDLGTAFGYVFRALADDRPSQQQLAEQLGITAQGVAKLIGEMVEKGYVQRTTDKDDSRIKRLALAPRGRAALSAARRFHAQFEKELSKDIGV